MKIFFTSDEHYGHANIIEYCKRPFANISHMKEELITRFNSRVGLGDFTYHLGDIFWNSVSEDEAREILRRLNGRHGIVWGNHDKVAKRIVQVFDFSGDVEIVKTPTPVWISHYAHRSWPGSHKGVYHLFGHTHGTLEDYGRSHDAGVDANNFFPLSFEEVDKMMKSVTLESHNP